MASGVFLAAFAGYGIIAIATVSYPLTCGERREAFAALTRLVYLLYYKLLQCFVNSGNQSSSSTHPPPSLRFFRTVLGLIPNSLAVNLSAASILPRRWY